MQLLRWDAGRGRETTFSFGVALEKTMVPEHCPGVYHTSYSIMLNNTHLTMHLFIYLFIY